MSNASTFKMVNDCTFAMRDENTFFLGTAGGSGSKAYKSEVSKQIQKRLDDQKRRRLLEREPEKEPDKAKAKKSKPKRKKIIRLKVKDQLPPKAEQRSRFLDLMNPVEFQGPSFEDIQRSQIEREAQKLQAIENEANDQKQIALRLIYQILNEERERANQLLMMIREIL